MNQLLDFSRRHRIERRARLVHQDHFGLHGDGAGDAQALLLTTGQAHAAGAETILHFVPEGGTAQGFLHDFVELRGVIHALQPQAKGDILVN